MGPTWGWRGGVAFGLGFVPAEPYGFCATGNLFAPHVGDHMVGAGQAGTIGAHTRPYVAANPTVNGTGGLVAAHPRVNGPSPQVLGIPPSAVAHGALANRGVVQARAFAHASTALNLGAHEPQTFASRSPGTGRGMSFSNAEPSHFGGKLGSGFSGSVNNMPHAYGSSYGRGYGSSLRQRLRFQRLRVPWRRVRALRWLWQPRGARLPRRLLGLRRRRHGRAAGGFRKELRKEPLD